MRESLKNGIIVRIIRKWHSPSETGDINNQSWNPGVLS